MTALDDKTRTELEAAAFRTLVDHLRKRTDVQNIDLMNLAGFCRNCLSKWYLAAAEEKGVDLDYARAREIGHYLRSALEAALGNHPNVGDIRGVGLFLGVELVADRETKQTFRDSSLLAWLTDQMRQRGLILRNDDRNDPTTQLCPPLVITRAECDRAVAILEESITELGRRLGTVGTRHAAASL